MRLAHTHTTQMHLLLENKTALDHENLFHDRNDRRVILFANGRNGVDDTPDGHPLYLDIFTNKIFFDDLFMMMGRDSGCDAAGLDGSPLDR